MGLILESVFPVEIYGSKISIHDDSLDTAWETLDSYATDLLIYLHMSATASNNDRTGFFLLAHEGKSEEWVRSYIVLVEDCDGMFSSDRLHYGCTSRTAADSLSLYPELSYENTPSYYRGITALTGVVTTIQYRLKDTEGHYSHTGGRLLSYTIDRDSRYGDDKLVRITSPELTHLILSRPEDWERIADIVVERKTDDTAFIRSILDGASMQPMTKGVL